MNREYAEHTETNIHIQGEGSRGGAEGAKRQERNSLFSSLFILNPLRAFVSLCEPSHSFFSGALRHVPRLPGLRLRICDHFNPTTLFQNSMKLKVLTMALLLLAVASVSAQQHRAVRLGYPATRFAPPLSQPEQLRALLTDEKLQADVAAILAQAGWKGNVDDLRRAAATAPITEVELPIGTRMPFMSSRKDGKPIALMDVLWAGDEPISAYAFEFSSNHRRYRCVTPKPCSNFYVVDIGEAKPDLAIECSEPGQVLAGQRFDVCLTVTNKGTAIGPSATLALQVPAQVIRIGGVNRTPNAEGCFLWNIDGLPPKTATQVCATFVSRETELAVFTASVQGADGSIA